MTAASSLSASLAPPRRRSRAQERHAELLDRLARVREQQREQQRDCAQFLRDAAAPEKTSSLKVMRELRALAPEVTVLCAQTGAVVERIANANDVAAKMTKEVRRLDILQSRLTSTLAQSSQLLSLRNALAGIRRAMQLHNYPEAATFLKQLKQIEQIMPLDVADKLRVDTIESDLTGIIESSYDEGLRANDRAKMQLYAPLFQIVSVEYEERGFVMLLEHITQSLELQLAPLLKGSFSTKEIMDHLTTIFNQIAAIAQEFDQLAAMCFARVKGVDRLICAIYAIGEKASGATLASYMSQRKFHDRVSELNDRADHQFPPSVAVNAPASSSTGGANARTAVGAMTASGAEDAIALLNEQLNEVALVIQHTQTYERFMRSRIESDNSNIQSEELPEDTPPHNAVLPSIHESELGKTVQELAGYYCFFENDLLNKAARKAFQWEELRYSSALASSSSTSALSVGTSGNGSTSDKSELITFPISSAIDEIFYVARNSGLRGLATGHADCAAGVLNMINTVVRDALGDTMRTRIRNMASYVTRFDQESGLLLAASTQIRDQMQQGLAKLSKIQAVGNSAVGGAVGNLAAAAATSPEVRKELGPDVVMNSLEATGDYIQQLKREIESELREDFDHVPSHLQSCLSALDDAALELQQLLVVSRKKLCKVLEPKLIASLAPLLAPSAKKSVSYELSDQMFTFNEANDPFAHAFVVALREIVAAFQPSLSPTNFRCLVETLAATTAELLEKWFFQARSTSTTSSSGANQSAARFTALGALQFDKDLRVVSSFFTERNSDCRARFAVLTQIAMVLSVDAPADVHDFYGRRSRGGADWSLSAAQVKAVLARRVEFSVSAIDKLQLD